jgi:MSHA pilin protein MshC
VVAKPNFSPISHSALDSAECCRGFTLVELVALIVLLGILSAVILPKFSGRSGFAEQALADQLVASLRYAQQRAMYDQRGAQGICYRLLIDTNGFVVQRLNNQNTATTADDVVEAVGPAAAHTASILGSSDYRDVSVTPATEIVFDGLGNALGATGGSCAGVPTATTIIVSGSTSLSVHVSSTGYAS